MIELECPMCEAGLLLAPAAESLQCRDCAITIALTDDEERWAMPLAA